MSDAHQLPPMTFLEQRAHFISAELPTLHTFSAVLKNTPRLLLQRPKMVSIQTQALRSEGEVGIVDAGALSRRVGYMHRYYAMGALSVNSFECGLRCARCFVLGVTLMVRRRPLYAHHVCHSQQKKCSRPRIRVRHIPSVVCRSQFFFSAGPRFDLR